MKKLSLFILLPTIAGLMLTRSMYLDFEEFMIIAVSLSAISISLHKYLESHDKKLKGSTAIIGLLLFWPLAIFDLVIDHLLYKTPHERLDGRSLTVIEKIQEYSDDLVIASLISMATVIILTFMITKINQYKAKK